MRPGASPFFVSDACGPPISAQRQGVDRSRGPRLAVARTSRHPIIGSGCVDYARSVGPWQQFLGAIVRAHLNNAADQVGQGTVSWQT